MLHYYFALTYFVFSRKVREAAEMQRFMITSITMMNRAVRQASLAAYRRQLRPAICRLADPPRFFAKKKKQGGGGGSGGGSGGGNPLTLQLCYSPEDIVDPEPFNSIKFNKPPTSIEEIMKKLEDITDTAEMERGETCEYYADGEWKELTDPSQQLKGKNIPIRIPSMYEDEEYAGDDEYDDNFDDEMYGNSSGMLLDKIKEFVETLKESGYTRSTDQFQMKSKDGVVISTKEWVLNQAKEDKSIQNALLSNVGGLDHVVQCLHYDFLWDEQQSPENPDKQESE
jgi:hypothetical protein